MGFLAKIWGFLARLDEPKIYQFFDRFLVIRRLTTGLRGFELVRWNLMVVGLKRVVAWT